MVNYSSFGEIVLNKSNFNDNSLLNDLIKINDNRICFICPTIDRNSLNIVIFNLYNNDLEMTIRYYLIEINK